MNWKSVGVLLLGCLAVLFLAASPASAQCVVNYSHYAMTPAFVGPFTSWVNLNAEGLTERPSDIVISGAGCFTTDSTLEIQYNAVMSVPTSISISDRGTYWDFYDSSDSMSIDSVTVTQPLSSSGYVTKIQIHINLGTVNPTAEVIIKNLRFDVTGTTGTGFQSVADGTALNAYVGTTNPTSTLAPFEVGLVLKTIALGTSLDPGPAWYIDPGWGFEDGVCPFSVTFCGYPNKGGTNGGFLIHRATFQFSTNQAWTTDFPFRRVGETFAPYVNDPNNIGPTDFVLDVEDIPAGVTVAYPASLYVCGESGTTLVQWTASGTLSATGGSLQATYKTVYAATSVRNATLTVYTNNQLNPTPAPSSGCPLPNVIGVGVGDPSGNNADGNMTATLRIVMGPAVTGQFTGDDVQPSAVPRYLNYIGDATEPTREIIGNNGTPVEYFYLNPTETVLLYPYVTLVDGWNTGIEVGNTGNDGAVFGNPGQAGKLDVYFFPTVGTECPTCAPFEYTVAAGVGRGLDTNGNLQPGGDFADTLSDLVSQAGKPFLEGYLIIVAHFNFGHGASMILNPSTESTAIPALVLGGHCSYNPNVAPMNPTNGAPSFPACSSARQGDLTKLPEQLKM